MQDANGCQNSKNILVTNPNGPQTLTAVITNASCGNSNGSIVATGTGGALPLQYSINGTVFQASTTFTLLPPATYPLTVKDANGCTKVVNTSITNLAGPVVTASSTLSSCFANDGTITAVSTGGTGAVTYSKNGIAFQASPIFTNLPPATYTITCKDTKGCLNTTSIVVGRVIGPTISVTGSNTICGGNIIVTNSGGLAPFQYNLNVTPFQNSNMFICQFAGFYMVRIIDANGCMDSATITLSSPLPVELISFTGQRKSNYNLLEWTTASEVNNNYFILEKSNSVSNFEFLSKIAGAGNSNELVNYSFKDEQPYSGINYYRLKQIDFNGSFEYSKIIAINSDSHYDLTYYFNSVDDELVITGNDINSNITSVSLFDTGGRLVHSKHQIAQNTSINTSSFAAGLYSLEIETTSGNYRFKVAIY